MAGSPFIVPADLFVQGDFRFTGSLTGGLARSQLQQDPLAVFPIPWTAWRVWNAYETNLPGTSASDDLGLYSGAFGSASPSIQTFDLKAAGASSLYARCMLWLPPNYDAGQTVTLRFHAGMLTTVADVSATVDAEVFKSNGETGIGSDLVTTAATSINSMALANKDFTVDPSGLSAGDVLDLRVKLAINDAATATAVKGIIGAAALLLDIKG